MKQRALAPLRPLLKAFLNPVAREALQKRMGVAEGRHLLDRTWDLYPAHLAAVNAVLPLGVGPALVMRLSVCTIALHAALMEKGETHEAAVQIAGEIAWAVYRRDGADPVVAQWRHHPRPREAPPDLDANLPTLSVCPSAYVWESKPVPSGSPIFMGIYVQLLTRYLRLDEADLLRSLQDAGIGITRDARPVFVDR